MEWWTAYVEIFGAEKVTDGDVYVHGGFTFEGKLSDEIGRWVGWDYAHAGDANAPHHEGHSWTLEEVVNEAKAACRAIEDLRARSTPRV